MELDGGILYEAEDGVARITINRPERLNALTPAAIKSLLTAFEAAEDDASIAGQRPGERHEKAGLVSGFEPEGDLSSHGSCDLMSSGHRAAAVRRPCWFSMVHHGRDYRINAGDPCQCGDLS